MTPFTTPADLYLTAEDILLYPGPDLYSGDVVTFDVTPRNVGSTDPYTLNLRIYQRTIDQANVIAEGVVGIPTFDGVPRARLIWTWDTVGQVGDVTLIAWLDPDDRIQEGDQDPHNNIVTFTASLFPRAELSSLEAAANWTTTTSACCELHYMTGTSADRDMPTIVTVADESVAAVEAQLGVTLSEPLDIYFVGRVIGHGGYAYDAVALSYLDRHYAGFDLETVIRHEATHVLDAKIVQVYPPALLREGLAVWIAGGHFKPEPIVERAAALLQLDQYIALESLASDFYRKQHEIGYLEGAAFVAYLVDSFGWDSFRGFYGSFDRTYDSPIDVLDAALIRWFDLTLAEADIAFQDWLQAHPPAPEHVRDLQDTVYLFDTIRRYQATYDVNAYWLSGWLPNPTEGEIRGIEADFLRHPRASRNVALETMLIAAREGLRVERFDWAEELIDGVNRVLDTGAFAESPEADYLALVEAVAAAGYEAQQVELDGDVARVWAIAIWPTLEELTLRRTKAGWEVE